MKNKRIEIYNFNECKYKEVSEEEARQFVGFWVMTHCICGSKEQVKAVLKDLEESKIIKGITLKELYKDIIFGFNTGLEEISIDFEKEF